ncbi:cuticle protein 16.5 isoform X2 [Glossina fuscipes]|uniref:Cuticle protein 16.5 isoform X2 n=1 Tax=Glossina fuscipes TaxID=7396 RepID=A0A9C5Z4N2_9MUSC|nr:cuticle protein 16.5 isoform X2 [Glossina fuscipes]
MLLEVEMVIIFVLLALIACAYAMPGGPAAYAISAAAADAESFGQTQEHTVKGHYGQNSQSEYSTAVETAHSSSHVQRTSHSNDVYAAAPVAAPVAHAVAAPVAHAAPAISVSHAVPSYAHGYTYAAAAPSLSHSYVAHAPAVAAVKYTAAPVIAHGALVGSHGYAAHYAAAAPAYTAHYAAAPTYTAHYAAAPAYTAHYAAAPAYVKTVAAAPAVVHTSFSGHGVHY